MRRPHFRQAFIVFKADSAPVQDRVLFDLFTTGLNDNATRGTLSVNQSGLAAWSAVCLSVFGCNEFRFVE